MTLATTRCALSDLQIPAVKVGAMTSPKAADTAQLLKMQVAVCLLVWLMAIVLWLNGASRTITWITTALAIVDTGMCGYFFVKFRSLQGKSNDERLGETPDDTMRRLTDSSEEQTAD